MNFTPKGLRRIAKRWEDEQRKTMEEKLKTQRMMEIYAEKVSNIREK